MCGGKMKIGILVNIDKDIELNITKKLYQWLVDKTGLQVLVSQYVADHIGCDVLGFENQEIYAQSELIIVLGGDGTLLRVAREVATFHVPLLGVNLGHLGFLTEIETDNLYFELDKIINKQYQIEERTMLEAHIINGEEEKASFLAFNDVGISRGVLSRIIRFNIYINDQFVDVYSADGVLVASPTGSTGYSLSAGGAILCPSVKALIITPICAHNLYSRSIVIADDHIVKIVGCENNGEVMITMDGQKGYSLSENDILIVKKSEYKIKLVKISDRSFFDILRTKITER